MFEELHHQQVAQEHLWYSQSNDRDTTTVIVFTHSPYFSASLWAKPRILILMRAATTSVQEASGPTVFNHSASM